VDKFLSNLTDWYKFPPRILFAITVVCGVFLFGGSDFFKTLGLDTIQYQGRPYFGLGFLLFGALFISFPITEGSKWFYKWLKQKNDQQQKKSAFKKWFAYLTPAQTIILRSFIENNTRSQSLNCADGEVNELKNAGIIYLPTNITFFDRYRLDGMYADFNIQPWVWDYLKKHPETLKK
jgi:hypothetical protein